MPTITEEKALDILTELIKKPESKAEDIPRIWSELLSLYNGSFAPPPEPPKKKRRKRSSSLSPNLGWPQGVSRAEYSAWKDTQLAKGVTEGVNPQRYKQFRDQAPMKPTVESVAQSPKAKKATTAAPTVAAAVESVAKTPKARKMPAAAPKATASTKPVPPTGRKR